MSSQDPGRYITRPSVIILFLICVLIYYALPSRNNTAEPLDDDDDTGARKRLERRREIEQRKQREHREKEKEKAMEKEFEKSVTEPNEFVLGSKRYKLYEKKRLNFKKAEVFCKKRDGQLAQTHSMEEMQRLQMLLKKAKMVSDEIWIGVNKKEWKKHAWKNQEHPAGINPEALSGMNAMMMGGGKQEMCPALSSSTRALSPAMCLRDLPFVCEFDRYAKPKPKNVADEKNKKGKGKNPSMRGMGMDPSMRNMDPSRRRMMDRDPSQRNKKPSMKKRNRKSREEM